MIVLGITDGDDIVRRKLELFERCHSSGRLVHAGRQDHHGALVEDDLQLQSEVPNDLQHRRFIRFPGRHDRPPDRKRLDVSLPELLDEDGWRGCRNDMFLLGRGVINQRTVFRDNAIEQLELGKCSLEIRQVAAGDQDEPAPGLLELSQGLARRVVDDTVVSYCSVEVGGESEKIQEIVPPPR